MGTSPEADVRQKAAESLGRVGGLRATVALRAALEDRDTAVRIEAVVALGTIKGARAVDALLEALKGADRDVRGAALQALIALGDDQVLPVLIEMVRNPRHPLRRTAVTALGGFRQRQSVETLLVAVGDNDRTFADLAATALGRVGGHSAVEPLLRLRSPSSMRALGRIGHPSAADGLIQTLGNVRNEVLRAAAADALLALHRGRPNLRLDVLANTGGDVRLLAASGDPRASAPLCGWLFAPDPNDRIAACQGLAQLGDSSFLSTLESALSDRVPEVCRAAAEAMKALDPDRSWDPLSETIVYHMGRIAMLGDEDGDVDELLASIDFLARLGATLALPTLHSLEEHCEWSVRQAAKDALARINCAGR